MVKVQNLDILRLKTLIIALRILSGTRNFKISNFHLEVQKFKVCKFKIWSY